MTAGPTCPSCKVAVLPGYAKCPKCHHDLPYARKRSGTMGDSGGTSVEAKQNPLIPIVVAVVVSGVIIAFFALRNRGSSADEATRSAEPAQAAKVPVAQTPTLASPPPPTAQPLVVREDRTDATRATQALEKALRTQRLWSTLQVVGDRLDVRSATCADPAMAPTLDAASPSLHGAGLTRLRCVEESGAVVFERAL